MPPAQNTCSFRAHAYLLNLSLGLLNLSTPNVLPFTFNISRPLKAGVISLCERGKLRRQQERTGE